jgi:hypothetical protein
MSTTKPHEIRYGDRLKQYTAELWYYDSSGVKALQSLTGATVTLTLVNAADGTVKVSAASATVVNVAGIGGYDWAAADVDTPGKYFVTWAVTIGGEVASFPVDPLEGVVLIHGRSQSALEAYQDAVDA